MPTTAMITVRPLTAVIGAEIGNIDLRSPLDDVTLTAVRQALLDHLVVFFRDQDITPEQHRNAVAEGLRRVRRFAPAFLVVCAGFDTARGVTEFFEPGPGSVLTGLLGKIDAGAACRNVQKVADLERGAAEAGKP